jgi:hypothetical protein
VVTAQFNPKELQVDREVPWNPTGDQENPTNSKEKSKKSGGIDLEFTGAKGRSLTLELLFDGYEKSGGDGWTADVSGEVGKLEHLASIRNPEEKVEEKRRPHWCVVNWGTTLQGFRCVISSLSTKYTMFDPDGTPLRATCTVKLMEADSVARSMTATFSRSPSSETCSSRTWQRSSCPTRRTSTRPR